MRDSEQTKQKYIARALQLCRRAKTELQLSEYDELDVRQLVVWLNEHKSNINAKSWRQYKRSIIYYLEQINYTPLNTPLPEVRGFLL